METNTETITIERENLDNIIDTKVNAILDSLSIDDRKWYGNDKTLVILAVALIGLVVVLSNGLVIWVFKENLESLIKVMTLSYNIISNIISGLFGMAVGRAMKR